MAKVSDMLRGYDTYVGDMGRDVLRSRAEYVAAEMSQMLETIYRFHCVVDKDELLAAWDLLNAMERAAWKLAVKARGRDGSH